MLPLRVAYFFADILYLIIYYVVRYRLSVVRMNIGNSFPEKNKDEKRKIEKRFYRHFADVLVEIPKLLSISSSEMLKRIHFANYEVVLKHYDEGRSVIMMAGHIGNWEWITSLQLLLPENKPLYAVYKKLRNENSDKLFQNFRSNFGAKNVEMNDLLRKRVAMKRENNSGLFGMVSDQSPKFNTHLHFVEFLNQPTSVIEGSEQLAKKFNFPVYYIDIHKVRRGYYNFELKPITTEPEKTEKYEITEKYMRLLEENILRQPELWLWSHKRWKHKLVYSQ